MVEAITETEQETSEKEEELKDETKLESQEETSKKATDEEQFDKDKQMIEFERSNARRAREERDTLQAAYEQASSQLDGLRDEIKQLKSSKQEETNRLIDMDEEMVDKSVAKNIQLLEARLKAKEQQLDNVMSKIEAYEQKEADNEARQRNEQARQAVFRTVEEFLSDMGVEGAGKYRNEASDLADEYVDNGTYDQPQDFESAVKLIRKCYLEVKKEKDAAQKKKSVSVDTGKGGMPPGKKSSEIKKGTLAEVKAQMLANQSWKEEPS